MFTNFKNGVVTIVSFVANLVKTAFNAFVKVHDVAAAPRNMKSKVHAYLPYILLLVWLVKPAMITAVVTFVGQIAGGFVFLLLVTYIFATLINDLFLPKEAF